MRLQDLPDDGEACLHCGAALPLDDRFGLRKFCSNRCKRAEYRARRRRGRSCEHCGGPVPETRIAGAIYCSRQCAQDDHSRIRDAIDRDLRLQAKAGRTCDLCGGPIPATKRAGAETCSKKCQERRRTLRRRKRA